MGKKIDMDDVGEVHAAWLLIMQNQANPTLATIFCRVSN